MKRGFSIDKHMNSYTKLLTDLVNVNLKIDEEDKTVILLNSLPDEEYETFTLTLINGRQIFNYSEVSYALVNYKVRRQDSGPLSKIHQNLDAKYVTLSQSQGDSSQLPHH